MSSSSGAGKPSSSPTDTNAPAVAMGAKLMVATGSGDVQQLKDLVNIADSEMMMVVMTSSKQAASTEKPHQVDMDPHLLALALSGSYEELESLLNGEDSQDSINHTNDIEAKNLLLEGVTAQGDTALHAVATYGQDDGNDFVKKARIIATKAKHLLFERNKNGDTPLHCAARAGKSDMVSCLIDLTEHHDGFKGFLRQENNDNETALHEAVRIGNNDIVKQLIQKDLELARFPEDGASPLYLAIVLKWDFIVETIYDESDKAQLSYSGQNGQNALHAAILRGEDLTKKLLGWNKADPRPQNKDLCTQRDENGSTPLHFAAALMPSVCQQVLEANAAVLYQPDQAGLFPIHVAASVGASGNIDMFVQKHPRSAGLRDAMGKTFLHVAVEKKQGPIIHDACRNLTLSWIMNMRDNDGNTALHLAVQAGNLGVFCPLLGNQQVNLNLTNKKRETPLDIAHNMIPRGRLVNHNQNTAAQIRHELESVGAMEGVRRMDHFSDNKTPGVNKDERKEMDEMLKDSTQTLSIGSVLIASVTFGTAFAIPGANDPNNGGTPTFGRRYAFDAFFMSNTLAFVFSAMATIALMRSGSPRRCHRSRSIHYSMAEYSLSLSVKSLAAAFALGAYVVVAPVAHTTAVATCILSCLVVLYGNLETIWRHVFLLPTLCRRKGLSWALSRIAYFLLVNLLYHYWPLIFIFGWAAYAAATPTPQLESAVQPPANMWSGQA